MREPAGVPERSYAHKLLQAPGNLSSPPPWSNWDTNVSVYQVQLANTVKSILMTATAAPVFMVLRALMGFRALHVIVHWGQADTTVALTLTNVPVTRAKMVPRAAMV